MNSISLWRVLGARRTEHGESIIPQELCDGFADSEDAPVIKTV